MPGLHTATKPATTLSSEIIRLSCSEGHPNFEEIYFTYQEIVRRICLRMLHDPTEAEDATHDVFMRVLQKLHTFRGESAFSSWLYRVTTNLVLMRFRKNKGNPMLLTGSLEDNLSPQIRGAGRDRCLEWATDRIDLEAAIRRLPHGNRRVFVLHDIEGYRHKEIANHFGCSIGNSKSQLHKARRRLRTLLGRQETESAEGES